MVVASSKQGVPITADDLVFFSRHIFHRIVNVCLCVIDPSVDISIILIPKTHKIN